jgi:hypothetical protein
MRERTRLQIERIRQMADQGLTITEAANSLNVTYHYTASVARQNGIVFQRARSGPSAPSGRNVEICRRYLAGAKQIRLAEQFGITRERVRQIIEKAGLVSETKRHADYIATVAGAVARKGLTLAEAADMFNTSRMNIYNYCREHGVRPATKTSEEAAELNALAQQVVEGKSIRKAAGLDHNKAERLRRHMAHKGITAKGRSRHDDMTDRKLLVAKWRQDGFSWPQCAQNLSEHDGRPISVGGLYMWCQRHMPELFRETAA